MPVVGAFARVECGAMDEVRGALKDIEGVSTFALEAPGVVGVLVECDSLEGAHYVIDRAVPSVPGVMGAWPVYVGLDDATGASDESTATDNCDGGAS
jgi:nitrate reductase NapAB chaperone NapD